MSRPEVVHMYKKFEMSFSLLKPQKVERNGSYCKRGQQGTGNKTTEGEKRLEEKQETAIKRVQR